MIRHGGWLGYVIPNSSVSLPAHKRVRLLLRWRFDTIRISNFSIRPQPLFPGVMQRVAIVLARRGNAQGAPRVLTTRYIRPTAATRPTLFEHIRYADISGLAWQREDCIPKLGDHTDVAIYEAALGTGLDIGYLTELAGECRKEVYYHDGGESYWTKALAFPPKGVRNGEIVPASKWNSISIPLQYAGFTVCVLNTSFFYWYWLTTSDCRDLTKRIVLDCPIPKLQQLRAMREEFENLCTERCVKNSRISVPN